MGFTDFLKQVGKIGIGGLLFVFFGVGGMLLFIVDASSIIPIIFVVIGTIGLLYMAYGIRQFDNSSY